MAQGKNNVMIVICQKHGSQAGLAISPDIAPRKHPVEPGRQFIELLYTHDNSVVWAFYVSREFAEQHHLTACVEPLPDDPGEWIHKISCCCVRCFEEAYNGYIDDSCKWHYGPRK